MTTLTEKIIKQVVRDLLITDRDYRQAIIALINAQFMDFTISFFQQIVQAKVQNKKINIDWYKAAFINENMKSVDIATNAGINLKTISNIHGSAAKNIVISAAHDNYESLKQMIKELINRGDGVELTISIKLNNVSIDLDISESLIVINALAVKRATLRGGVWSSVGKQAEGRLMLALCHLYSVSPENYDAKQKAEDSQKTFTREIDFFLVNEKVRNKCEVKLMGKGNPESADAVIARASKVFVADTLSQTNIKQLDSNNIEWVHLRTKDGYRRFAKVLKNLGIPYKDYQGNIEDDIEKIIEKAFS